MSFVTLPFFVFFQKKLSARIDTRNNVFIHTNHFSKAMKKAGGVVYSNSLSDDSVVLHEYAKEYTSLPHIVFNPFIGHQATTNNLKLIHVRFVNTKISSLLGSSYYNEYLKSTFLYDFEQFGALVENYIKYLEPENVVYKKIDISDLIIYVLSEISYMKVFGPSLSKDEHLKELLESIGAPLRIHQSKYYARLKEIASYVEPEIQKLEHDSFSEIKNNGIAIIKRMYEEHFPFDPVRFSIILYSTLKPMIFIPESRLLNVLVDFSSDPTLQNTLVNEQISIMKQYGKKISLEILEKMHYLDAALNESLLMSAPASFLHRKVKKDVVLSNGITIPKKSFISLNLFEKYNQKVDDFGNRLYDINKYFYKKLPKEEFVQSLIWGYGR
ncbi:hypothetical protein BB560_002068 [Smittium megazygosporum]|uniref:Uncharacterized protein n=1 Tax=Smittium megazygosporum TaxID=133381 RepID=A0A2T9ZFS7_9FUNG|nr:hypothetical protein BB560_002068 [Smittium megazygosporum]